MEIFDAHCHLESFKELPSLSGMACATSGYSAESNAKNAKIRDMLNSGTEPSKRRVFLSCGIAPQTAQEVGGIRDMLPLWIEQYMAARPDAIGEIGLDWHWGKSAEQKERQLYAFEYQLELAVRKGIPVVIHCRDAVKETLSMLESYGARKFMMHCFTGTHEEAARAAGMGGIISVPPLRNKERKKSVKAVGMGKIVCETDSPYIGKTLNDINVSLQIVSDSLSIPLEEAAAKSYANALQFYSCPD
ncbi:MAG: TatD family hydrolase [Candidatus Micrarchaeia archaeon]